MAAISSIKIFFNIFLRLPISYLFLFIEQQQKQESFQITHPFTIIEGRRSSHLRQFVEARSQRIQITGSGPFWFWPPLCRLSSTCVAGRPFSAFQVHRTWVCLRTPRSCRSPLAYNLHIHRSVSSSCNWKFKKNKFVGGI